MSDHRRRGRDEGVARPEGSLAGPRRGSVRPAAALPADAQQHRRREELHHHLPASHRRAAELHDEEVRHFAVSSNVKWGPLNEHQAGFLLLLSKNKMAL